MTSATATTRSTRTAVNSREAAAVTPWRGTGQPRARRSLSSRVPCHSRGGSSGRPRAPRRPERGRPAALCDARREERRRAGPLAPPHSHGTRRVPFRPLFQFRSLRLRKLEPPPGLRERVRVREAGTPRVALGCCVGRGSQVSGVRATLPPLAEPPAPVQDTFSSPEPRPRRARWVGMRKPAREVRKAGRPGPEPCAPPPLRHGQTLGRRV